MKATHKALGVLLAVLVLATVAIAVADAQVKQPAEWITAKRLTVDTSAVVGSDLDVGGDVAIAGTLNGVGNAAFDGTLTANGTDLIVAQTLAIAPQTAISVTNGGVLTPTGTVQMLTAAGNVTPTLGSGSAGDVVMLINTANLTITIADTTGQIFSGNIALGQWDTATLVFYGTSWIQVAESDN